MSVMITDPKQMESLALFVAIQAMETHIKFGGRMRLTACATPQYIARRFDLKDAKGKAPKTAKKCLELLRAKRNKQEAEIAQTKIDATTFVVTDIGTNN